MTGAVAPLWLAVHEAGHAVARLVLDELYFPGPYLRSVSVVEDGDALGMVCGQARLYSFIPIQPDCAAEMIRDAKLQIIQTLAGPIAEAKQRLGVIGPYVVRQPSIDVVLSVPQAPTEPLASLGQPDDYEHVKAFLDWLAPPDPNAELLKLWAEALKLVEAEWTGILAVARVLRKAGTMDGEDFEQAWRAGRKRRAKPAEYITLKAA